MNEAQIGDIRPVDPEARSKSAPRVRSAVRQGHEWDNLTSALQDTYSQRERAAVKRAARLDLAIRASPEYSCPPSSGTQPTHQ